MRVFCQVARFVGGPFVWLVRFGFDRLARFVCEFVRFVGAMMFLSFAILLAKHDPDANASC